METPSKHSPRSSRSRSSTALIPLLLRCGLVALLLLIFLWMVKGSPISSVPKTISTPVLSPSDTSTQEDTVVQEPLVAEDITATLTLTGDFIGHLHVVNSAYDSATDSYDFTPIFQYAGSWMDDTDYLIGNLETTLSGGTYSGSPYFNSPDDLAVSLHQLGYDLLTTANNHCLDQDYAGLRRTLDVLDENDIAHVGTYRTQEEFDQSQGVLVQEINGLSVAFLDYTYGVNYAELSQEDSYAVNLFNLDTGNETNLILNTDQLDSDMAYARSLDTDLIVVLIHWGIEYETTENADQDTVADYLIARGADAVLGGHAHVPQPLAYRTVTGIDGTERTGFVCYSLGNLVSNQADAYTNITAALKLTVTKDGTTGETAVTDVTYTPLFLLNRGNDTNPQYLLLDTRAAIADYEGAQTNPYITESVYNKLQDSLTDLTNIFGAQWAYTE